MIVALVKLWYRTIFPLLLNVASHKMNLKEKIKIMEILTADVWYANNHKC